MYQLSQLAGRYNPERPEMTVAKYSSAKDYQDTLDWVADKQAENRRRDLGVAKGEYLLGQAESANEALAQKGQAASQAESAARGEAESLKSGMADIGRRKQITQEYNVNALRIKELAESIPKLGTKYRQLKSAYDTNPAPELANQVRAAWDEMQSASKERAVLIEKNNALLKSGAYTTDAEAAKGESDLADMQSRYQERLSTADASKASAEAFGKQYESAMAKPKIDALSAVVNADSPVGVNGQKDFVKMGSLAKEIDANMQKVIDGIGAGKSLSDPDIASANSAISDLNSQYMIASQGQQYDSKLDNQYAMVANASRNKAEATKAGYETANLSDDAKRKTIIEAADKAVKSFTASNSKVIEGLNLSNNFKDTFEAVKNGPKTPASFAILVKAVNKLMEPGSAVMSDDMATMAKYGGNDASRVTEMTMMGKQIVGGLGIIVQAMSNALPQLEPEYSEIAGVKVMTGLKSKANGAPVDISKAMAQLDASARKDIGALYSGQWSNIVNTGERLVGVLNRQNDAVYDAMDKLIAQLPATMEVSGGNAFKLATGKTVAEAIKEDPYKSAFDNAVKSNLSPLLRKSTPGAAYIGSDAEAAPEAATTGDKAAVEEKATEVKETSSKAAEAQRAKYLSPIGRPAKPGEKTTKDASGKLWAWSVDASLPDGGRWVKAGPAPKPAGNKSGGNKPSGNKSGGNKVSGGLKPSAKGR